MKKRMLINNKEEGCESLGRQIDLKNRHHNKMGSNHKRKDEETQECLTIMEKMTSKRAQEEMFGFVLVVVLVVVAGLMFLLLQNPKQADLKNDQISNLLYSMISYSSSYQNKPMGEVLKECDLCDTEPCETCDIAEREITEILKIAQEEGNFVAGKQVNGYLFNASGYKSLEISEGELKGNNIGNFVVVESGKDIVVALHIYY